MRLISKLTCLDQPRVIVSMGMPTDTLVDDVHVALSCHERRFTKRKSNRSLTAPSSRAHCKSALDRLGNPAQRQVIGGPCGPQNIPCAPNAAEQSQREVRQDVVS